MPIANCIITKPCTESDSNLVELWAKEANIAQEHITINIIEAKKQLGNQYAIMSTLLLPSMWAKEQISLIQLALANSLAKYYNLDLIDIHIVTRIIESSLVLENGEVLHW